MRLHKNLFRNLDFGLGGGKSDTEDDLTDEQKAELARLEKEVADKAAKEKADKEAADAAAASGNELKQEEGESNEDFQARLEAAASGAASGDDSSILKVFASEFGEVEGLDEIPESIDGIKDYFTKLIPEIKKQAVEELVQTKPLIAALNKHLDEGKSFETFRQRNQAPEVTKVAITKDTEPTALESIIRADLAELGVDEEAIKLVIQGAKDADVLVENAKKSQKNINTRREKAIAEREQLEVKAKQQSLIDEQNEKATISSLVNGGKILGVEIPKTERQKLLDFVYKPIDSSGVTAREKAMNELTYEQLLYIDYLVMAGKLKSVSPKAGKMKTLEELKAEKIASDLANLKNNSRNNGSGVGSGLPSLSELLR